MAPSEWGLGSFRGNRHAGYAALDDSFEVRLQVWWMRAGQRHVGTQIRSAGILPAGSRRYGVRSFVMAFHRKL